MNLNSLDLNLLLAFEALFEERSVSRAARRLSLTQPATSNALARLRDTFQDPLFLRQARGMQPTARALQLAGPITHAMASLRAAIESARSFDPGSSTRTFRIATSDYFESLLAPRLLSLLRDIAPEVRIQFLRPDALFRPPDDLQSGRIDLALGFFAESLAAQTNILIEDLWEEPNVVVYAPAHQPYPPTSLDHFTSARHAAVFYSQDHLGLIDRELAALGRARQVLFSAPDFDTVLRVVSRTDLIATIAAGAVRISPVRRRLATVPLPFRLNPFVARLAWWRNAASDSGVQWLRDTLRNLKIRASS